MKATHTPGPWMYSETDKLNPYRAYGIVRLLGKEADLEIGVDGATEVIAEVCDGSGPGIEADARLIASAPELLAALEGLVSELFERTHEDGRMMSASFVRGEVCRASTLQSARALLSKVKGNE